MGLVLVSFEKVTIEKSLKLGFSAINNEVEYEALLAGMAMVQKIGKKNSRGILRVKIGRRLGEGGVKGQKRENARIFKSS